jgi:hypothetical protein
MATNIVAGDDGMKEKDLGPQYIYVLVHTVRSQCGNQQHAAVQWYTGINFLMYTPFIHFFCCLFNYVWLSVLFEKNLKKYSIQSLGAGAARQQRGNVEVGGQTIVVLSDVVTFGEWLAVEVCLE